jgi:DNA-directed RNA polymerase subunit D
MEVLKKEEDKIVFRMSGVSPAFANMLRREIIESVPVMAVEDVEFRENSSALYDEVLAHRLGLIPLITDLKSYTLPAKCKCGGEGCARCQVKLVLKAKGPCTVYASDIKSKDPNVRPVYPKMIVAKLLKSQEIELEATAVLGQGKDHMKFASGLAFYHSDFEFKQSRKLDNADEIARKCPAGVFKAENGKLVPLDESKSDLYESCLEFAPQDAVSVREIPGSVIFTVESWGQISPKEMLVEGCESFISQIDEFEGLFK